MTTGHWQRLRLKGGGPRGGGGGHAKGPLRKVVRRTVFHTVHVSTNRHDWRAFVEVLNTEDGAAADAVYSRELNGGRWDAVRRDRTGIREVLECGHCQPERHDLIGPTNAVRRRCAKCKRGAPPDVQ